MRASAIAVFLLLTLMVPVVAGTVPTAPLVAYKEWSSVPVTHAADEGVAVFQRNGVVWAHILGTERLQTLSGAGSGAFMGVAASSDHIAVSRSDVDGLTLYRRVIGMDPESPLQNIGSVGWVWKSWTAHGRPGWFGRSLAITEGMVIGSVDYPDRNDQFEVYEILSTGRTRLVQTIDLPGSLAGSAYDALQVRGADLLILGAAAVWHYRYSAGSWELMQTITGVAGVRPFADIGDDLWGQPMIAYAVDGERAYVAPLEDPVYGATFLQRSRSGITSIAVDDGTVTVTDGGLLGYLSIYGNREGVWEATYRPRSTEIGRLDAFERADVSNGHIVVKGIDYGIFEPSRWVRFYAIPEAVAVSPSD